MSTQNEQTDGDMCFELVELDRIVLSDKDTDRILEDAGAIASLADTIRAVGVLQPVGLASVGGDGCYRVIWGRRRIAAAREAGLAEIPSRVKALATESELIAVREIENLHRLELNPIEESDAVAKLYDLAVESMGKAGELVGLDEQAREDAILRRAAEQLGKPLGWVRDRAFLARLEGKGRELVLAGLLPLSHAREVAKVADPEERDRLADLASAADAAGQPLALGELREAVARQLYALTFAPWKLEVPFGDFPACTTCPHNSANRPGLFDHHERFAKTESEGMSNSRFEKAKGTKAPDVGVCTNKGCFGRKATATKRALNTAAGRVVKAAEAAGLKQPTPKVAAEHVPEHVETKAVLTVARQKIERLAEKGQTGSKVKARSPAAPAPKDGPHMRAVESWKKANDALEGAARKALRASVAEDPMDVVGIIAAQISGDGPDWLYVNAWDERAAQERVKAIRESEKWAQSTRAKRMIKTLTGGATEEVCAIIRKAAGERPKRGRDPWNCNADLDGPRLPAPTAVLVLAILGVQAEYRSIDSFLATELDKAKAPAKAAAKKKAAKKAGKKTAKKKAGKKRAKKVAARGGRR